MDSEWDSREQHFLDAVREHIIYWLLFATMYVLSYIIICKFKRRTEKEDYYTNDDEDAMVYRIALWICTFTVTVSVGAVLLLPISIVTNEVLLSYPNSYYVKWLNESLIHGLWNQIFLFSNLALFILIPFAYFLTESEGFAGSKKGIRARIYETLVVLFLLGMLVFGFTWVLSALLDENKVTEESISDFWDFYLPYLYSCISLLGVLMLLISTPVGVTRLFSVIGQLVVKPQFMQDLDDEVNSARFEEDDIKRKLQDLSNIHDTPDSRLLLQQLDAVVKTCTEALQNYNSLGNGSHTTIHQNGQNDLRLRLKEIQKDRKELERRQKASPWQRNFLYPLLWLFLFALTVASLCMVAWNIFELLLGYGSLPVGVKELALGKASLSTLGSFGAVLEVLLILYVMLASLVGFYSVPFFRSLRPKCNDTAMTKIIANSTVLLILSSALPLLSRSIGITNFDLLGDFGRIDWLGNFYIVFCYNALFGAATASCLVNKFTITMRDYLLDRLGINRDKSAVMNPLSKAVNGRMSVMKSSKSPCLKLD
ncbi:protein LMBR1L-like [Saccoglossus kowalevskii]|uniref:LIMBR 1-like protein n=1 Tax=Saccoglossus kowalevskii TaxID=10224 RepID=A0A1C9TA51_SACKO|nr:PREDICTED: protein LMBR1L-like [Saccoglossus kowalevskii]AOR07013.1 LIMBR 1-like protein [Saccoglossus kowalevskii]